MVPLVSLVSLICLTLLTGSCSGPQVASDAENPIKWYCIALNTHLTDPVIATCPLWLAPSCLLLLPLASRRWDFCGRLNVTYCCIMHYALCIMHYALCIMHCALSIMHAYAWHSPHRRSPTSSCSNLPWPRLFLRRRRRRLVRALCSNWNTHQCTHIGAGRVLQPFLCGLCTLVGCCRCKHGSLRSQLRPQHPSCRATVWCAGSTIQIVVAAGGGDVCSESVFSIVENYIGWVHMTLAKKGSTPFMPRGHCTWVPHHDPVGSAPLEDTQNRKKCVLAHTPERLRGKVLHNLQRTSPQKRCTASEKE